ncbi:hypothetical protein LLH23_07510 [bacterium]|nr:hypothetical protein [bacterium]
MPRIPLSLSVYEHAASFLGLTPWEVCRSAELVYRAHREAYLAYRHFPLVVGIDIYNLEAEAYGAELVRPAGAGIPAITQPIMTLADDPRRRAFDPATAGRIPLMIEAAQRLQADFPEADVRLPVSGPFSVAQSLLGLEPLAMAAALEPSRVRDFLLALVPGQVRTCEAILAAGLGIAFFESAAAPPLLSPRQFREIELPALQCAMQEVSAVIQAAGAATGAAGPAALPCIIGGDTAPIVEDLLSTGTDFLICPAETDRDAFLARTAARPEVRVRVNLDPAVYTSGTPAAMQVAVDEVVKLAARRPNLLLGTGAIPYETPHQNIQALIAMCA